MGIDGMAGGRGQGGAISESPLLMTSPWRIRVRHSLAVRGGLNLAFFPRNQDADSRVILHDAAAIQALVLGGEV